MKRQRVSVNERLTPTRSSFGSWGYGSAPYLVNAEFKHVTGIKALDVPYKGAAPVIQALLSKEIDMAFVPLAPSVIDLIKTGKIKAIGVANLQRNPNLPGVPHPQRGQDRQELRLQRVGRRLRAAHRARGDGADAIEPSRRDRVLRRVPEVPAGLRGAAGEGTIAGAGQQLLPS